MPVNVNNVSAAKPVSVMHRRGAMLCNPDVCEQPGDRQVSSQTCFCTQPVQLGDIGLLQATQTREEHFNGLFGYLQILLRGCINAEGNEPCRPSQLPELGGARG